MTTTDTVDIISIGMLTPVGIGAAQTASSVRAGICRYAETSIMNSRFRPMTMALVPDEHLPPLESSLDGVSGMTARQMRLLRLAAPAIKEALDGVTLSAPLPLFLGAPEPLPGRATPVPESFLEWLQLQTATKFDLKNSRTYGIGRASFFQALQDAMAMINQGKIRQAIVGGVDSYLDLYLLGTLDAEERLLAEDIADGFVPGEGATFLIIGKSKKGESGVLAQIVAATVGEEPGHRYSEEPYRGDGLATVVQNLFTTRTASAGKVNVIYAGLNGESFGGKEWTVAYLRNQARFTDDPIIEHPADCFGDPGAALGATLVGLSAMRFSTDSKCQSALAWSSSEGAKRGAALIQRA